MTCATCQRDLEPDARFCGNCGTPRAESVAAEPAAQLSSTAPSVQAAQPPVAPTVLPVPAPAPTAEPTVPPAAPATAPPPAPPPAPPTAPPSALPTALLGRFELSNEDLAASARTIATAIGGAIAVVAVVAAVAAQILAPSGHGGGLGDWLRTGVILISLSLGGSLAVRGSGSGSAEGVSAAAAGHASVRFFPLIITVGVALAVAYFSRRDELARPSGTSRLVVRRAALTALVGAVALAVVGRLAQTSSLYGVDLARRVGSAASAEVRVGVGLTSTVVGALVLLTVFSLAGRTAAAGFGAGSLQALPASMTARLRPYLFPLRLVGTQLGALLAAAAAAIIALALFEMAFGDLGVGRGLASVILGMANGAIIVALFAVGANFATGSSGGAGASFLGVSASNSSGHHTTSSVFDLSHWFLLAPLLALVITVAAATRAVLRAPADNWQPTAPRALMGRIAAVGATAGLFLALLNQARGSGNGTGGGEGLSASAQGSFTAGPTVLSSVIALGGFAVVAGLTVRFAPVIALALPKLMPRLTYPGMHPSWRERLAPGGSTVSATQVVRARTALKAAGVVAGALVLGALVVLGINKTLNTPAGAGSAYYDAIAHGSAASAVAMLDSKPKGDNPLLSNAVLRSHDVSRISHVKAQEGRIFTGSDGHKSAELRISYTLDGAQQHTTLIVVARHRRLGLFPEWKVADDLARLVPPAGAVGEVSVAGVKVPQEGLLAFPAVYEMGPATGGYLVADPVKVAVGGDVGAVTSFSYRLTDEGRSAAQGAITAAIAGCIDSRTIEGLGRCFVPPRYIDDTWANIRLKLTQRPEYDVQYVPATSGGAGELVATSTHEGSLHVLASRANCDNAGGTECYEDVPVRPSVTLVLNGSAFEVSFQ